MAIQVGDRIPEGAITVMGPSGPKSMTVDELFAGKKVALFAVPGAFTPTCSKKHLPGFIQHADAISAKGVDTIVCMSVNDIFVMDAWRKDQGVGDKILMAADGSAKLTQALGLSVNLTERGMGVRSQRYSMVVEDSEVTSLNIDGSGKFDISSAETLLELL